MQGDNHTALVAAVKADLVARGVSLVGVCGAFAITQRVAWALKDEGAGLLRKPVGNNCDGFAADYIVYRNGQGFDILGDAGGTNVPQWLDNGIDPTFIARWRAAIDLDAVATPPPPPTLEPLPPLAPPDVDDPVERLVEAVDRIVDGLEGIAAALTEQTRRIDDLQQNGLRIRV